MRAATVGRALGLVFIYGLVGVMLLVMAGACVQAVTGHVAYSIMAAQGTLPPTRTPDPDDDYP